MKQIILFIMILMIPIFENCSNQKISFEDNDIQSVSFPLQTPVRTLVLGNDRYDNSIDLKHEFDIGVNIGGMYENNKDWEVTYALAPELLDDVDGTSPWGINTVTGEEAQLEVLPASYYEIVEGETNVTIPKGEFVGKIRIHLKDAFFQDEKAYKFNYVLPYKIISSTCPNIETGELSDASIPNVNPLDPTLWKASKSPKDYTLFGIKYVNDWHGNYFVNGDQKVNNEAPTFFHSKDISSSSIVSLSTYGYRKVIYHRNGEYSNKGYYSILEFSDPDKDGNGTINITKLDDEALYSTIVGTGKYYSFESDFAKTHGVWGIDPKTDEGISHLTITLDYVTNLNSGDITACHDTLVIRDRNVRYEEFNIEYR